MLHILAPSSGAFGGCRVLDGVLDDLPSGGVTEVDTAHVGEPDKVEQHVRKLLAEVLLLRFSPPRQSLQHLAFPHEQLRQLPNFTNLSKSTS
jgi:hypothetical protein